MTKSGSNQPKNQPIPATPSSENIPRGLARCPVCNEYRGAVLNDDLSPSSRREEAVVAVLCICDGIPCPKCGKERIHRPISNYWNEATGTILHCPYFSAQIPCSTCRAKQEANTA